MTTHSGLSSRGSKVKSATHAALSRKFALFPEIVVIRLQRHVRAEQFFGEPLQQHAGKQAVEVAFVRDDDFGLGQIRHGDGRLAAISMAGERGMIGNVLVSWQDGWH